MSLTFFCIYRIKGVKNKNKEHLEKLIVFVNPVMKGIAKLPKPPVEPEDREPIMLVSAIQHVYVLV